MPAVKLGRVGWTNPVARATVSNGKDVVGNWAGALRLLRETIDERSGWAIYLAVDPRLQPLSREPAFGELLKLAGLSEVARSAK